MKINFAHVRTRAAAGGWIDYAVFEARSSSGTDSANSDLLLRLTAAARGSGLKVDQAALAFVEGGRLKFYGAKTLVAHLSRGGLPRWTHSLNV